MTSTVASGTARLGRNLGLVMLAIIALTYVVNAMDRSVFPVLLRTVTKEYHFSLAQGGFESTVFTLGLGVAGLPTGLLLDRIGRKYSTVLGVVLYSVFTILTVLAIGVYDMAVYRAVSGVGEALQNAAIFTAVGAYYFRNRALALGVLNVAYGLGSFIGPRGGAALLGSTGDWRVPMYVFGAIGLVGAVVVLLAVPRRFTEQRGEAPSAQEEASVEGHMPTGFLHRNTLLVALAAVGGGLAGYGYLGLYPTFLQGQLHFSLPDAGAAASFFGLGAFMGLACGWLADRISQKWLHVASLAALALVGYAIFNVATEPVWQDVLSFLEGTFSSGFLYVNGYSLIQRSVRSTRAGRASGLYVTCVYLPAALSGYLFALLIEQFGWHVGATIEQAAILVVPIVGMLFFNQRLITGPRGPAPAAAAGEQVAVEV
jgi:MFS family permease